MRLKLIAVAGVLFLLPASAQAASRSASFVADCHHAAVSWDGYPVSQWQISFYDPSGYKFSGADSGWLGRPLFHNDGAAAFFNDNVTPPATFVAVVELMTASGPGRTSGARHRYDIAHKIVVLEQTVVCSDRT